jgi:magnesium-dependent phosphatase 1
LGGIATTGGKERDVIVCCLLLCPRMFAKQFALVVFDLDATLWETEMYLLSGPPFKATAEPHKVTDRVGDVVELMPGSVLALRAFATDERWKGVKVGVASRTDFPKWARTCIDMLRLPATVADNSDGDDDDDANNNSSAMLNLKDLIDHAEIYESDKKSHFRALHKTTGIPFEKMAFFDNEMRNITSVSQLGVKCFFTPDGMTRAEWHRFVNSLDQPNDNENDNDNDQ